MNFTKPLFKAFLVALTVLIAACSKVPADTEPNLSITTAINGLTLTLTGSAIAPNDSVTSVEIAWGDGSVKRLASAEISNFSVKHTYPEPGNYTVLATAVNTLTDSTIHSIIIDVDFRETLLDNIKPGLFKTSEKEFLILTVNLHTYQELQQSEKFNIIVDLIGKMDVDFIAFQECAQKRTATISTGIIREDNMAMIISDRLKEKYGANYNFVWDWAHYGWNSWEEGVAILSKHPLTDTGSKYISVSTSKENITSRKVIYGSYQVAGGTINMFSAHTHWRTSETDEEHNNQITRIKLMASEKEASVTGAVSFVCGDFNANPTSYYPWSESYDTMVGDNDYTDTFLEIYPNANNKPAQSIYNTVGGDYPGRIDYIFMKENSRYQVQESQIVFTGSVLGEVSDHFGVLTKVIDDF